MQKLDFLSGRVVTVTFLASLFVSLTIITFALVVKSEDKSDIKEIEINEANEEKNVSAEIKLRQDGDDFKKEASNSIDININNQIPGEGSEIELEYLGDVEKVEF